MMDYKILPSEHRKATLGRLKYAAERAETVLEGLYQDGPRIGISQWNQAVIEAHRDVTRAWHEWALLAFLPLTFDEPVVHEDWNYEDKCCGQWT